MGKLSGILLAFSALAILEFFVLSAYYTPAENWLSAFFGPSVYLIFGLIYFLLGDPFNNAVLLVCLVLVGALAGVGARKGTRAIGAAISVFTLSWAFIGLSALYIASTLGLFSGGGISPALSIGGLPVSLPGISSITRFFDSVPAGTNLSSLIGEPIIRRIPYVLPSFESSLFGGSGGSPTSFLGDAEPFFIYDIINFIIVIVSAGIVGFVIHRLLDKDRKKKSGKTKAEDAVKPAVALIVIAIAFLFIFSYVPNTHASADRGSGYASSNYSIFQNIAEHPSSLYQGNIPLDFASNLTNSNASKVFPFSGSSLLGSVSDSSDATFALSRNATLYSLYAISSNLLSKSVFANNTAIDSANFALLMDSSSLCNLFYNPLFKSLGSSGLLSNLKSLVNLIPPQILVIGFPGNASATMADQAASSMFSYIGVTSHVFIFEFSPSQGSLLPGLPPETIFLYAADQPFLNTSIKASENIISQFPISGPLTGLQSEISDGYMIPGSSNDSIGSTILAMGFLNASSLSKISGGVSSVNTTSALPQGVVYFVSSFSANDFTYYYATNETSLDLRDLTGSSAGWNFGNGFSMVDLAFPGYYPYNLSISGLKGYKFSVVTDNSNISGSMGFNSSYPGVMDVSQGYILNSTFKLGNLSSLVTPHIAVKSTEHSQGLDLYVNTTITNDAPRSIENVSTDAYISAAYGSCLHLISGSANNSFGTMAPGSSRTVSMEFSAKNPGVYYESPIKVAYDYNNSSYSRFSQSSQTSVGNESLLMAYNTAFDEGLSFVVGPSYDTFPVIHLPTFLVLLGLIILLDIYIEYKAFRRWLRKQ